MYGEHVVQVMVEEARLQMVAGAVAGEVHRHHAAAGAGEGGAEAGPGVAGVQPPVHRQNPPPAPPRPLLHTGAPCYILLYTAATSFSPDDSPTQAQGELFLSLHEYNWYLCKCPFQFVILFYFIFHFLIFHNFYFSYRFHIQNLWSFVHIVK